MKFSLIFLFFFTFSSFGQDAVSLTADSLGELNKRKTNNFYIASQFQYHPLDFFQTLEIQAKLKRFHPTIGLGTGINRTIFQQRFFPSIQVFLPYFFLRRVFVNKQSHWGIGPQINTYFLKINKQSNHHQFWHEYLLAYHYEHGRKWNFVHQAGFGYRVERFYSELSSKFENVGTWSYYISVGLKYRL